jgi:hypothetical protein
MSTGELSTFWIYLKGQDDAEVVKAQEIIDRPNSKYIIFKISDVTIAAYRKMHLHAWQKRVEDSSPPESTTTVLVQSVTDSPATGGPGDLEST